MAHPGTQRGQHPPEQRRLRQLPDLSPCQAVADVPRACSRFGGTGSAGSVEVWPGRRGDIARALFYMDVRYDGSPNAQGTPEPDLILTNNRGLIREVQTHVATAHMGLLCPLIAWHMQDPPDAAERLRNEAIFQSQLNRNPFIDRPELVRQIFSELGMNQTRQGVGSYSAMRRATCLLGLVQTMHAEFGKLRMRRFTVSPAHSAHRPLHNRHSLVRLPAHPYGDPRMPNLMHAVSRYGPRIKQDPHIRIDQLCDWLVRGSGLNANAAKMTLGELRNAVAFFLQLGSPVVVRGLGRLRLSADRHGELHLNFVAEKALLTRVLDREAFVGTMANAQRAGWTDGQYKAAWDEEFPDALNDMEVVNDRGAARVKEILARAEVAGTVPLPLADVGQGVINVGAGPPGANDSPFAQPSIPAASPWPTRLTAATESIRRIVRKDRDEACGERGRDFRTEARQQRRHQIDSGHGVCRRIKPAQHP